MSELVNRIAELKKSITPGPWESGSNVWGEGMVKPKNSNRGVCAPFNKEDAAFIALAPEMADLIEKQDGLIGLQRQMITLIEEHATFAKGVDKEKYLALHKQIKQEETL